MAASGTQPRLIASFAWQDCLAGDLADGRPRANDLEVLAIGQRVRTHLRENSPAQTGRIALHWLPAMSVLGTSAT